ncbi:MAG TPA: MFS transporter [Gammaproteobacteria bacterium]|nr:MFS transporter [Gammaproteobacteria bacterium]
MRTTNLRAWLIWLIAGLFYMFEFIHRVIVSVMIPELTEAFEVGSALLSSLSAAYFFAYALAQIPVGLLLDRYGTRILLTIACLAIAVSSFAFAYAESLAIANYCRVIIGLGSAFAFIGCLKVAATWFPAHQFAFVVGLTNLLGVVGALIGGSPTAYAVQAFGWRMIMYFAGIIGLIFTVLLWKIIRDSKNSAKHKNQTKNNNKLGTKLQTVVRNKQTWLIAIFAACLVAPIVTYSELWGVTYLAHTHALDRNLAARISSMTFIGIAIGGPTIGWLSDYFRQRTFFMGVGLIGAMLTMCLILFGPILPLWAVYLLHIWFGFFTSAMLLCFTLNSEETSSAVRATTLAFTNCVIMLGGAGLQVISGFFLEYTSHNYNISFIPLICCYVLALGCYVFIEEPPCRFAED